MPSFTTVIVALGALLPSMAVSQGTTGATSPPPTNTAPTIPPAPPVIAFTSQTCSMAYVSLNDSNSSPMKFQKAENQTASLCQVALTNPPAASSQAAGGKQPAAPTSVEYFCVLDTCKSSPVCTGCREITSISDDAQKTTLSNAPTSTQNCTKAYYVPTVPTTAPASTTSGASVSDADSNSMCVSADDRAWVCGATCQGITTCSTCMLAPATPPDTTTAPTPASTPGTTAPNPAGTPGTTAPNSAGNSGTTAPNPASTPGATTTDLPGNLSTTVDAPPAPASTPSTVAGTA